MNNIRPCIAYIAPEIPGLSATFVYNEIITLEKKGYHIIPISIHRPSNPAYEVQSLADRTRYLYQDGFAVFFMSFIHVLLNNPKSFVVAIHLLANDFQRLGLFKLDAWKLFFHFFAACRLVKLLEKQTCQHIHIHFADIPTQIGMYASAITGIPFSVTSHANDIFEHGRLLEIKAIRSNCFATISEFNRDYLITQGVPKEKISIVRCGIGFHKKKLVNIKKNKKYHRIGSLGRLVEKKGMSSLLRAARIIIDKHHNIEVIIGGDGPLQDNLRALATELEIDNYVKFIGALPNSNVATWMNDLDLFVLACKQDSNGDMDGIPVVLMEAMSQGIPVISTRISGIPELIRHNETGLLSEPDDPESLAEQIIALINNPDLSKKLIENAMEYVFSEFSEDTNIKRLEHCFRK